MRGLRKSKKARTGKEVPRRDETDVEGVEDVQDARQPFGQSGRSRQHAADVDDPATWGGAPLLPRVQDESGSVEGASMTLASPLAQRAEETTAMDVRERPQVVVEPYAGVGDDLRRGSLVRRGGWTRSSQVRCLFEEDPHRAGHPLKHETTNKAGKVVYKIRCRICGNLFAFHNSSWTTASNHILSHNLFNDNDVIAAANLASEAEKHGEPFPMHKLPAAPVSKPAVGDVRTLQRFVTSPSYGTDTGAYKRLRRSIATWVAADCLPYRTVETPAFRAMARSLDPKCPEYGRKGLTAEVNFFSLASFFLAIVFCLL